MGDNVYDLSTTAGGNSSVGGMNWAEGQAPSTVNDSARQFAALLKQFIVDIGGSISAGGTANGLTVTASSAFTTYDNGRVLAFKATADNTGAATLSVNGIGAKSIRKMSAAGDVALSGGEIQDTGIYIVQYSTAFNAAAGGWLLASPSTNLAPTMQAFTATGLWTKTPGARFAVFEGIGGGGAGGGVDGQGAGTAGAGGGGATGYYGKTAVIDISATVSATVTIGAGGAAGAAGAVNGGAGGNTAITIGATTYTWNGGNGGVGITATASIRLGVPSGSPSGTNVVGAGFRGSGGFSDGGGSFAQSGEGGGSQFGEGGYPERLVTNGVNTGGAATIGFGGGGSGAAVVDGAGNAAGGAGQSGYMRVWEFY